MLQCRVGDGVEFVHRHVRRDLQEQRSLGDELLAGQTCVLLHQRPQQMSQIIRALQFAQAGRVRRADVHRQVIRIRKHATHHGDVVLRGVLEWCFLLLAEAHANAKPPVLQRPRRDQPRHGGLHTAVGKAHAVDESAIIDQAEHARLFVAGLRPRRQRADLHVPKTQTRQPVRHAHVLVESRRNAEEVWELQAKRSDRPLRNLSRNGAKERPPDSHALRQFQCRHRTIVRNFRIEAGQQGVEEAGVKRHERMKAEG